MARSLALCLLVLLAACGGESGEPGGAVGGEEQAEAAYQQAYRTAWVASCKKAVADLRAAGTRSAARVSCDRPVEQMEGNTSFDPVQARQEGRHQGTFDGCAYAWDEAHRETAVDVEPRC